MIDAVVTAGTGVDLVHVPSFAAQLSQPGTVFARVFTDREWQRCRGREESLAARWAAKESVVKAWSALLFGQAPALSEQELDWADIEVIQDRWDRPNLRFHGRVASDLAALEESLGAKLNWSLSLSHDGEMAIAYVQVLAVSGTKI